MSKEQIQHRLLKELTDARSAYDAANYRFRVISNEIPAGLPAPDGVLRISKAGAESRSTLAQFGRALRRFSDFTLRGTVPEDLRDLEDSN